MPWALKGSETIGTPPPLMPCTWRVAGDQGALDTQLSYTPYEDLNLSSISIARFSTLPAIGQLYVISSI